MAEFPVEFVDMLGTMPGHEGVAEALSSTESPTAIRLNPHKPLVLDMPSRLRRVPWEGNALYLDERPQFTFHTGLYDGRFYVQDPSSMIIGDALRRIIGESTDPINYLDACAAPGGKTTAAMSILPEGSFVLANEYDGDRVLSLIDNLARWGVAGYAVSRSDARRLADIGPVFDVVAADVPCSGEGMMRKNLTAAVQWSPRLIEECATLQRDIVAAVWQTVRPGGYLIYSTCTFNTSENERNAEWIRDELGGEPVDLFLTDYPGVTPGVGTDIPCARMLPGRIDGEGQFVAVFRKIGDQKSILNEFSRRVKEEKAPDCMDWIKGDFMPLTLKNGDVFAVLRQHYSLVRHIMSKTNVVVPGVHVASPKGHDLMPAHALATSTELSETAFPITQVDYATALSFLRGEALRLDSEVPKGYVLIAHGENRLGWTKNIGSRANNLFPDGLRIRSTHLPQTEPILW